MAERKLYFRQLLAGRQVAIVDPVAGQMANFMYLLGDPESRRAWIVDPAWDADFISAEAERLGVQITHILCTHSHFDHVNRVEAMLQRHDVPVHMLGEEIEVITELTWRWALASFLVLATAWALGMWWLRGMV